MLDLDIEQFWKDDALAHRDNCFYEKAPQMAMGLRMSDECVFAELQEEGEPWGVTPRARRIELNKRYNEKAVKIVGRPLLQEEFPAEEAKLPSYREIGEIFGGRYEFDGKTTWLKQGLFTPEDLEKRLDFIDGLDFKDFVLPKNWEEEKKRVFENYGLRPRVFDDVRGPVTLAMSVYGTENLIFLYYDDPDLFRRFSESISAVLLKYIDLFTEEAGYTKETVPHGFQFRDDDCSLLTPEMYDDFAYPILKRVFDYIAPNAGDRRYQHSDSAMAHQIPTLGKLNFSGVNFGPTVTVQEIRKYMKTARIDGQLAPFTLMNNDTEKIIEEVKRDAEAARETGIKGINFTTAGSVNNGSLLTSMRTVMAAIQNYGRFD